MVNLFVSIYNEPDINRRRELDYCLDKNIHNSRIDCIYILLEPDTGYVKSSDKIEIVPVDKRPTFKEYFDVSNSVSESRDVNIIINSDIFFEERDIDTIKSKLSSNKCFALTRYDVNEDSTYTFLNRRDSQDSWCFMGRIRHRLMKCDFYLGKPGCDNRIAHEIKKSGYDISNPSKTIKSFHLHNTQVKSYERTDEHVVKPPYLRLDPIP